MKREGVESKLNIYDTHALEGGSGPQRTLRRNSDSSFHGPPKPRQLLSEAYALGADEGYLLSDRSFAGRHLGHIIPWRKPSAPAADLILCGMQTTDGDTAQVGPGIAELLELPHVSYVSSILGIAAGSVQVEADMGDGLEELKVGLPCLITVTKAVNQPRLPSYRLKKATRDREITIWSSQDLQGANPAYFGLSGSPTQVERIFSPPKAGEKELWQGDPLELSTKFIDKLKELKYL